MIKGLPRYERMRYGVWRVSCEQFWGSGSTRQEAFAAWQQARKSGRAAPTIEIEETKK